MPVEMSEDDLALFIASSLVRERYVNAGKTYEGKRNLYETLGYKEDLDFQDYLLKYNRGGIAGRIVDAPAEKTWKKPPKVTDLDPDSEEDSPFTQAFQALADKLDLWRKIERADKISGIGRYGVLFIGVKTPNGFEGPVEAVTGPQDILYLSPYHEGSVEVSDLDDKSQSERFGQPKYYNIDFGDGVDEGTKVHWSRVIHITEHKGQSDIYGRPRLKRIFNRLTDLEKVIGGSAETFWRTADRGLHLKAMLDEEGVPYNIENWDEVEEQVKDYIHRFEKIIKTQGIEIESLGSDTAEPGDIVDNLIALISGTKGIPQRVLLGSERGELASTQDESNWVSKINSRQTQFAEPDILRKLVDRFIEWGALPEPQEGNYEVVWPNLFELTELEEAKKRINEAKAAKAAAPMGDTSILADISELRQLIGLPAERPEEELEQQVDEENEQVQKEFDELDQSIKNRYGLGEES